MEETHNTEEILDIFGLVVCAKDLLRKQKTKHI